MEGIYRSVDPEVKGEESYDKDRKKLDDTYDNLKDQTKGKIYTIKIKIN